LVYQQHRRPLARPPVIHVAVPDGYEMAADPHAANLSGQIALDKP
jgi:hypothetical protein